VDYDGDLVDEIADKKIFVCPTTSCGTLDWTRPRLSTAQVSEDLISGRIDRLRRMREAGVYDRGMIGP
jgi:hypothetical protein